MAGRPSKNQVTHVGTRRSETKKKNPHPYAGIPKAQLQRHIEENMPDQYPGMHCVIVTKTNDRDAKAASPVNDYKSKYKMLSDDPAVTGHGDAVLMGIPVDDWLESERVRMESDNAAMKSLIDGTAENFENMPKGIRFEEEGSGLEYGEDIVVSGKNED